LSRISCIVKLDQKTKIADNMKTTELDQRLRLFKDMFKEAGIDASRWKDETWDRLYADHSSGLAPIVPYKDGDTFHLEKHVTSVVVSVYRFGKGNDLQKLEEIERIRDGKQLPAREDHSVSIKALTIDNWQKLAERCVRHKLRFSGDMDFMELNIDESAQMATERIRREFPFKNDRFILFDVEIYERDDTDNEARGLLICREIHPFICFVPVNHSRDCGFVRKNGKNKTHYEWRDVFSKEGRASPYVRRTR